MADLTVGRVYLARRIGFKDGKPLFKIAAPCDFNADTIHLLKREGYRDVKPIGRFMTASCDTVGGLVVGDIYPARRIGFKDGKPLFKVVCNECAPCECCHCCGCDRFTAAGICCTDCFNNPPAQLEVTITVSCMGTRTLTLDAEMFGVGDDEPGGCQNVTQSSTAIAKFAWSKTYTSSGGVNFCGGETLCDGTLIAPGFRVEEESLEIRVACQTRDCPGGDTNDCEEYDTESPPDPLSDHCVIVETTTTTFWGVSYIWTKTVGCTTTRVEGSHFLTLLACDPLSLTGTSTAITCDTSGSIPPVDPCPDIADCDGVCVLTLYDDCVGDTVQIDVDEV